MAGFFLDTSRIYIYYQVVFISITVQIRKFFELIHYKGIIDYFELA